MRWVTDLVRSPWYSAPFASTASWIYLRCSAANGVSLCQRAWVLGPTIVEARQADFQAEEDGHAKLLFQRFDVDVVVACHPALAERLEPGGQEDLDVLAGFGDIAVFGAVDAADDEVGDVRGEVELDGGAHVRADGGELGALFGGNGGAAENGASKRQLAGGGVA